MASMENPASFSADEVKKGAAAASSKGAASSADDSGSSKAKTYDTAASDAQEKDAAPKRNNSDYSVAFNARKN